MDEKKVVRRKVTRVKTAKITVPPKAIIPKIEPQPITYDQYQRHTPETLEYIKGYTLWSERERYDLLLCLLTNIGVKRFIELLPDETIHDIEQMITWRQKQLLNEPTRKHSGEMGKKKAIENIARNLVHLGKDDDFVQKATGLDIETIKRLKA